MNKYEGNIFAAFDAAILKEIESIRWMEGMPELKELSPYSYVEGDFYSISMLKAGAVEITIYFNESHYSVKYRGIDVDSHIIMDFDNMAEAIKMFVFASIQWADVRRSMERIIA